MTKKEFMELCNNHLVLPSLALESSEIREALANKDNDLVKELLEELF